MNARNEWHGSLWTTNSTTDNEHNPHTLHHSWNVHLKWSYLSPISFSSQLLHNRNVLSKTSEFHINMQNTVFCRRIDCNHAHVQPTFFACADRDIFGNVSYCHLKKDGMCICISDHHWRILNFYCGNRLLVSKKVVGFSQFPIDSGTSP